MSACWSCDQFASMLVAGEMTLSSGNVSLASHVTRSVIIEPVPPQAKPSRRGVNGRKGGLQATVHLEALTK